MPQTKPPASEPAVRRHQTPIASVPSMIMWMIRMPLARANGSANATTNPIEIVYAYDAISRRVFTPDVMSATDVRRPSW